MLLRIGRRRPPAFALVLVVIASAFWPSTASARQAPVLKVMTRNVYLGASLDRIFDATTLEELVTAASTTWGIVQLTDFPERADSLAEEISAADPHVVGLQEAEIWTIRDPLDPRPTVVYDYVQLLLDALAARGRHYIVGATAAQITGEVPVFVPGEGIRLVGLVDRQVILARADLPSRVFSTANGDDGAFVARHVEQTLLGPVEFVRGWTSLDVTLGGNTVRVVNTHLERFNVEVQEDQAAELLSGPAGSTLPSALLGDLNSAASGVGVPGESVTETYEMVLGSGFTDAWSETRKSTEGLTCCQTELLLNRASTLTERVDVIFVRDAVPTSAHLVGDDPDDRTPSGLWPSDHAGVVANVRLLEHAL
jgi:hypothetical protein